jgi:hypothetical protein
VCIRLPLSIRSHRQFQNFLFPPHSPDFMGNCFGSDAEPTDSDASLTSSTTSLNSNGKRPPVTPQDIDDLGETDPLVDFLINPSNDTTQVLKFKKGVSIVYLSIDIFVSSGCYVVKTSTDRWNIIIVKQTKSPHTITFNSTVPLSWNHLLCSNTPKTSLYLLLAHSKTGVLCT